MFLFCAALTANAQDIKESSVVPGEDVILQWNRVLAQTVATPGAHPVTIATQRSFAMMHLAMFNAVNSIDRTYAPYLIEVPVSLGASREAAAAQAAHDVLVGLYPSRQAIFNAELADLLAAIPRLREMRGLDIGRIVAQRMLAARANNGWLGNNAARRLREIGSRHRPPMPPPLLRISRTSYRLP